MIPVVTPTEMRRIDEGAREGREVLIGRAGRAVARAVLDHLGGTYGRRVVVVAGPGDNGADGRVAAAALRRRGVRVTVVGAEHPDPLPVADLVVDAAFGTGLSRSYDFPSLPSGVPVVAVDIPSGVDGVTGEARGRVAPAIETVTFVALKPGLLHEPGRGLAGRIRIEAVAGLSAPDTMTQLVEAADVAAWIPPLVATAHKWQRAVRVIGGSATMPGAVRLAAAGALRFAGLVEMAVPGGPSWDGPPEAVMRPLPNAGWGASAAAELGRFSAVLAGPGLVGASELGPVLATALPLVLDASALHRDLVAGIRDRPGPTVVTPHDGEFARLGGSGDPDRIAATRDLARDLDAIVLRKGPTTVVAAPSGAVRVVANGGPALATAGSGDVLGGVIAALVARGAAPFDAAAAGAWLHAEAGRERAGLIASDLPAAITDIAADLGV